MHGTESTKETSGLCIVSHRCEASPRLNSMDVLVLRGEQRALVVQFSDPEHLGADDDVGSLTQSMAVHLGAETLLVSSAPHFSSMLEAHPLLHQLAPRCPGEVALLVRVVFRNILYSKMLSSLQQTAKCVRRIWHQFLDLCRSLYDP